MPVSELEYYEVGLDYFCHEVLETSKDSQRLIYEDPAVELRAKIALDTISHDISSKEVGKGQENTTDINSVTANSLPSDFLLNMETVQKHSGLGGGITRTTFKQDAKAVYNKMLRDSNEHLISGFGQWEFLALLGPRVTLRRGGKSEEI